MHTKTKRLIFSVRNYYICTSQSFVTEYFHIFIVDEMKNFTTNNIYSSCWSQSHTWDLCKGLVTNLRFMDQGKEDYYKIKSNWVLTRRFNYRLVFQDKLRVVGKISYTCNHLIVAQRILGSGNYQVLRPQELMYQNFNLYYVGKP